MICDSRWFENKIASSLKQFFVLFSLRGNFESSLRMINGEKKQVQRDVFNQCRELKQKQKPAVEIIA